MKVLVLDKNKQPFALQPFYTKQITLDILDMTDQEVLALCHSKMSAESQDLLSSLLSLNQEGKITPLELEMLDDLMIEYNQGLLLKAEAMVVAKQRGLIQSTDDLIEN